MKTDTLHIIEMFVSLEGETSTSGYPALFIRLAQCNLRCSWCDTKKSWNEGREVEIDAILKAAEQYRWVHHVTVTGGEPLLQENVYTLLEELVKRGMSVQLETNGSLSLERVPSGVRKIADVKPPSSGHGDSFLQENLSFLNKEDELKIVIYSREDLEFARVFMEDRGSSIPSVVSLSAAFGGISYEEIAAFVLSNKLKVRFVIQLHAQIWPGMKEKSYEISLW
jgi:7-carboxy-7-deazaguanine synthase